MKSASLALVVASVSSVAALNEINSVRVDNSFSCSNIQVDGATYDLSPLNKYPDLLTPTLIRRLENGVSRDVFHFVSIHANQLITVMKPVPKASHTCAPWILAIHLLAELTSALPENFIATPKVSNDSALIMNINFQMNW